MCSSIRSLWNSSSGVVFLVIYCLRACFVLCYNTEQVYSSGEMTKVDELTKLINKFSEELIKFGVKNSVEKRTINLDGYN